jgi:hypothetical protein
MDPTYAKINADLSAQFKANPKATPRSKDEAPKKAGNTLK